MRLTIKYMSKKKYSYKYAYEKTLLPQDVKEKFSAKCKKNGVFKTEVLRNAIYQYLKEENK